MYDMLHLPISLSTSTYIIIWSLRSRARVYDVRRRLTRYNGTREQNKSGSPVKIEVGIFGIDFLCLSKTLKRLQDREREKAWSERASRYDMTLGEKLKKWKYLECSRIIFPLKSSYTCRITIPINRHRTSSLRPRSFKTLPFFTQHFTFVASAAIAHLQLTHKRLDDFDSV